MRTLSLRLLLYVAGTLIAIIAISVWALFLKQQPEPLQIFFPNSQTPDLKEHQFIIANGSKRQQDFIVFPQELHATGWISRLDLQRQYRMIGPGDRQFFVETPGGASVWRLRVDAFEWRPNYMGLLGKIRLWLGLRLADGRPPIISEPITNNLAQPLGAANGG